jgi:AAA+ ATPase superfamily predicted ATPase
MFLGRTADLALLEDKWESGRFEFGCLYGTRRIGKTTLVSHFIEGKPALYFQAKEASELENRRGLSKLIDQRAGYPEDYVFPSWDELLRAILKLAGGKRFAFVIDEYPYLAKATKNAIASYLQDFIDHEAKDSQLFLLLLGSSLSFMEKELKNKKSPLYRRRTFSHKLGLLPYSEALLFLKDFPPEEKLDYLSLFGFSPYYLALLEPRFSFENNVKNLLFSMGSTLLDAPDLVMPNGTRNKEVYNSILLSISRGKSSPTEIGSDLGMGANEVSKYLGVLSEEGIIEKKTMFGSKRKIIYRIKDPVLLFYYASLYEDVERIRIGYGAIVYQEKKEEIHQRICHGFEDVCLHYLESASVQGRLPHPYYPIQNLVIEHSELGRSIEIDGLSRYGDSLLVVECKYTQKKRGLKDLSDMKEDVSIRMFAGLKEKEFYLFSKNGFEDTLLSLKEQNLHLLDSDDLLSGE